MNDQRAVLMATDPPYLVDYDGGNHPPTWANGGKAPGAPVDAGTSHWDAYVDHDTSLVFYEDFLRTALERALTETPVVYMFFGMMRAPLVFAAWEHVGLLLHQVLIWRKSRIVLSRCDYCWNYEPARLRLAQGQATEGRAPPAGQRNRRLGDLLGDRGRTRRNTRPASRSSSIRRAIDYHTNVGELDLRALLRLGHGTDRRRDDRQDVLRPGAVSPSFATSP